MNVFLLFINFRPRAGRDDLTMTGRKEGKSMANKKIIRQNKPGKPVRYSSLLTTIAVAFFAVFFSFCLWLGWQVTEGFSQPYGTPEKISNSKLHERYRDDYHYDMDRFLDKYTLQNMGRLTASDGNTFPYYLVETKDRLHVKGAIILCHCRGGDARSSFGPMEIFLDKGWDCYSFDMRGTYQNDSNVKTFGVLESRDLDAVVKAVKKDGYKHIGIWGASVGGETAGIYSALPKAEKVDFYIMDCPIVDPYARTVDLMKANYGFSNSFAHFAAEMGSFMSNMRFGFQFRAANLIEQTAKVEVPRLFISCGKDRVVPPDRIQEASKAAKGKQKLYYSFSNCDHLMGAYDEPDNYRNLFDHFLKMVYEPEPEKPMMPKDDAPGFNALVISIDSRR